MHNLIFFMLVSMLSWQSISDEKPLNLTADILELDRKFFTAFNTGDIETLKQMMHPELEFYHDKAGLTNYQQTLEGLSELMKRTNRPNRRIIENKSEVYPVPNFGAIQVGQHEFCNTENNVKHCGIFKFNHVWQNINGQWKIKRIVSYDH
ncbi:MAG: nuclear transport factor 2 family protein [Gammaproteobacteria bacterium]|nr:nuclear transport factor 2 family protein [Gammaproteobacteria bacterium]